MEHHPPPEVSQDTRQRLLVAATLVFAEKNFDGASIRDIAQHAQANSALVQYYFGGKEGLYLETLRFVFEIGAHRLEDVPQPPAPSDPEARPKAIAALRAHVRMLLCDCMAHCKFGGHFPPEIEKAALSLWNREMQAPRPQVATFIKEAIRPYIEHIRGCIQILRPELDEEGLFRMGMSIHGQMLHLHNHPEIIRLVRGAAYTEDDLESLTDHFTQFSLRGLSVPEACQPNPQGA